VSGRKITLIPGDGIGPEVTRAAVRVLETVRPDLEWETFQAGQQACQETGEFLPQALLDSVRRNKLALKGPVTTPVGCGFRSVNVELRKRLGLYAGVRPSKSRPGIPSCFRNVDLVVVRENTEGLYSGLEHEVSPGIVESIKVTTEKASRRIARYAFDFARRHGRHKVTVLHKANIMKLTDGLFLRCAEEVAAENGEVAFESLMVDNACFQLARDPNAFDVLLADNLTGDIISDLCAGLVGGGLGVAPGANVGDECIVFEAVHGAAPDIAGTGRANPLALIASGALMLKHLGHEGEARRIENAIDDLLAEGAVRTPDLEGTSTTEEVTEAICGRLA
jgi:isocitrate dehydrogenase (NAD+)